MRCRPLGWVHGAPDFHSWLSRLTVGTEASTRHRWNHLGPGVPFPFPFPVPSGAPKSSHPEQFPRQEVRSRPTGSDYERGLRAGLGRTPALLTMWASS